jgi:hypothetical protein
MTKQLLLTFKGATNQSSAVSSSLEVSADGVTPEEEMKHSRRMYLIYRKILRFMFII